MNNLYLHPVLASDTQLIEAVETVMKVTAHHEGHRVRLERNPEPEIININTTIQASEIGK